MPINQHINVALTLAIGSSARANFGVPMFVCDHDVNADRINGPYSSLAAVVAAGFNSTDEPAAYNWARTIFGQMRRVSQVYIGLWNSSASETLITALDAIEAVNPAAWYCTNIESRVAADIVALANWTEARAKIAMAQTDDAAVLAGTASTAQQRDITVGGTATDGDYVTTVRNRHTGALVATVTTTRTAGSPATNANIATQHAADLEANTALAAITSPIAAVGAVISMDFLGLGNEYSVTHTAPAPGTLTSVDNPAQVVNVAEILEAGAYTRTALWYHDDDTEYLDAMITSLCLGFNLDAPQGAGSWSYQRGAIVPGTNLSDAQKQELTDVNCNWYSTVRYTSGVEEEAFSFPGVMAGGRFIDITTSIDLTAARMEEAGMGVFLLAASSSHPKVPYTDDGLQLFGGAFLDVFSRLVKAGHYAKGAISPTSGEITPRIVVPLIGDVSAADKTLRRAFFEGEGVLTGAINSVGDTATVGLAITVNV